MKIELHHEFFRKFPYKSDFDNGRTNNGGIDLLQNPDDIEKIHEAKEFPALREFFLALNAATSPFMTLGCACGEVDGHYYTYVQFSFRDITTAQNELFITNIDSQFNNWLPQQVPGMEEMAQEMCRSIAWESQPFLYYETEPRLMITMHCRSLDQANTGLLLGWIHKFLIAHVACQIP